MLPIITAKVKDDTLQWLCANTRLGGPTEYNQSELLEAVNVYED